MENQTKIVRYTTTMVVVERLVSYVDEDGKVRRKKVYTTTQKTIPVYEE